MSTIVTRSGKGSPLTHTEVDSNFTNLNTDKYQEGSAIGAVTPAAGTFTTLGVTTSISASGAGANVDLNLASKGTGVVNVKDDSVTVAKFLYETSSDTSFWKFRSRSGDGLNVGVVADGTASNIGFNISTKGTAAARFFTGDTGSFSGGVEQARVSHTTSAVNYVQVTGAATGTRPAISSQGSDTNIGLQFISKGTGTIRFDTRGGNGIGLLIGDSGSATNANYIQITGAATTISPTVAANGSDTNISQVFQSKGTGAIDLAAGSSGVNISNGGTVTAITRTNGGSNYTSAPTVTISAPTTAGGVQATATVTISTTGTPTVTNGGTGYTVGDVLTISGGTPVSAAATLTVTAVSGGVITAASYTNFSQYTTAPSNPVSVTGGTGSSATFTISWGTTTAFTITNAGSGYVEQPTVSFSGGGGSGAAAYATVGSGTTVRTLGSTIDFTTPGGRSFQVYDSNASQVNYFAARGSAAGTGALLFATGSDTNIDALLLTKGTGAFKFLTNSGGQEQLRVAHTASAVNYVQVTGAATGGQAKISSQGSDTNVGLGLSMKGWSNISFFSGNFGYEIFRNSQNTGTPANFVSTMAVAAGSSPYITPIGSDTNIDLALTPKGTGSTVFNTALGIGFKVVDPGGGGAINNYWQASGYSGAPGLAVSGSGANVAGGFTSKGTGSLEFKTNGFAQLQFAVSHTASAVNYVQVTGAATASRPTISSQGSDSSIGLNVQWKGTGNMFFQSGAGAYTQLRIWGTNNAVNNLAVTGTAAGSAPILSAEGSDTNIDLALTPKGTGVVQFGTYTGTALSIAGYITIKDAGGTVRKLAVVA